MLVEDFPVVIVVDIAAAALCASWCPGRRMDFQKRETVFFFQQRGESACVLVLFRGEIQNCACEARKDTQDGMCVREAKRRDGMRCE